MERNFVENVMVRGWLYLSDIVNPSLKKVISYYVVNVMEMERLIGLKKQQEKNENHLSLGTHHRGIKGKTPLNEGEMVCDKCEGFGSIPSKLKPREIACICKKCNGTGKVDWIENIVGKKPPPTEINLSGIKASFVVSDEMIMESTPMHDDKIDIMAQLFARKIDAEIMESLTTIWEQNDKYKTASNVFKDMED